MKILLLINEHSHQRVCNACERDKPEARVVKLCLLIKKTKIDEMKNNKNKKIKNLETENVNKTNKKNIF